MASLMRPRAAVLGSGADAKAQSANSLCRPLAERVHLAAPAALRHLPHQLPRQVAQRQVAAAAHPMAFAAVAAKAAAVAAPAGAAAAAAAGTPATLFGLTAGQLFGATSAIMVPIYFMIAFIPTSITTRATLLNSPVFYLALAALHAAVLVMALQHSGLAAALSAIGSGIYQAITQPQAVAAGAAAVTAAVDLAAVARLFGDPWVTLLAWVHLLTLDVLMAREIALDGLRKGVATAHSVLLCFFFGPTGLLSHAITRLMYGR